MIDSYTTERFEDHRHWQRKSIQFNHSLKGIKQWYHIGSSVFCIPLQPVLHPGPWIIENLWKYETNPSKRINIESMKNMRNLKNIINPLIPLKKGIWFSSEEDQAEYKRQNSLASANNPQSSIDLPEEKKTSQCETRRHKHRTRLFPEPPPTLLLYYRNTWEIPRPFLPTVEHKRSSKMSSKGRVSRVESATEEEEVCVVCFRPVETYSIGECDHPVCFECSTRMRVLCGRNECPICRKNMAKVSAGKGCVGCCYFHHFWKGMLFRNIEG